MSVLNPSKLHVAVLRGGPSSEYDVSLKSGEHVLSVLRANPDRYDPLDIFISKAGEWHRQGLVEEPHRALRHVDVVWNGLHGRSVEGQVHKILEQMRIPFTGSTTLASAVSQDRDMTKRLYRRASLFTPAHEVLTEDDFNNDRLITIFRTYVHPVVVKPVNITSAKDVRKAHTFHELKDAIKEMFTHSPKIMVEEYIRGDDVSCAVVEEAKGERLYAFLPHSEAGAKLKTEENNQIEDLARQAHELLGLRHYSNSDFIITPKKKIYILKTNSHPVFHDDSLTGEMMRNTGWRSHEFVDHVLRLALK